MFIDLYFISEMNHTYLLKGICSQQKMQ